MKAVRRVSPGSARLREVEPAQPGTGEVLVEVAYAGVNPFDVQVLRGEIGPNPEAELTLGAEATARLNGRLVLVAGGGLGAARNGLFAAQAVVPLASVHHLPDDADPRAAATVGVAGRTAWRAVHQLAQVTADDVVLVLGAAGGVGNFAAQLARQGGAEVLAQTASPTKAEQLAALGLEPVLTGDPAAVVEAVRGRAVSVVLDPLGGDYLSSLLGVLAPGARAVSYGVLAGRSAMVDLGLLYGRGVRIFGTSGGTTPPAEAAQALTGALDAVVSGAVSVAHEVLALADGPHAFARLAERSVLGKLLLQP